MPSTVFPGDSGEGVTPGVTSKLRHHILWLFYSRGVKEKSLWHKLRPLSAEVPEGLNLSFILSTKEFRKNSGIL